METMEDEKDKKAYEIALLLKAEEDLTGAVEFVHQHNAEAASEPRAKKLALAYTIKGHDEAVFASFVVKMAPADAKQLERDLLLRPEVIRSMVMIASTQVERPAFSGTPFPMARRGRPTTSETREPREARPAPPQTLSNEALEKKIEEILQ